MSKRGKKQPNNKSNRLVSGFVNDRRAAEAEARRAAEALQRAQAEQAAAGDEFRAAVQTRISALEATPGSDESELVLLRAQLRMVDANVGSTAATTGLAEAFAANTVTDSAQFARARGMRADSLRLAIEAPPRPVCGTEGCRKRPTGPKPGKVDESDGRWYCHDCWIAWEAANGGGGGKPPSGGGGDGKGPDSGGKPPSGGKKQGRPGRD